MSYDPNTQLEKIQPIMEGLGFPLEFNEPLAVALDTDRHYFRLRGVWAEEAIRKTCDVHFYRLDGSTDFTLDHYVSTIRKPIPVPAGMINGIDIAFLEQRLGDVDWYKVAPAPRAASQLPTQEALNEHIGGVLSDVYALGSTEEGKIIQKLLRAKYFSQTPPLVGTALQRQFDAIDQLHSSSLLIPVRHHQHVPNLTTAFQQVATADIPARLPATAHEIYGVKINGPLLQATESNPLMPVIGELRYFSSLSNAYNYVQGMDDRIYLRQLTLAKTGAHVRSAIYDCTDAQVVAVKGGFSPSALSVDGAKPVVGWQINTDKTTTQQFENKTGLPLAMMTTLPRDQHVYIYPPAKTEKQSGDGRRQGGKKTRDGTGRGL